MRNNFFQRIAGKAVAWALIVVPLAMINIVLAFVVMVWLSVGEKVMEKRGIRSQKDIQGFQLKSWLSFFYWAVWWPRYLASHLDGRNAYFGRLFGKILFVWLLAVILLLLHPIVAIISLPYLLCGEWLLIRRGESPLLNTTFSAGVSYEVKRLSKALIWPAWCLAMNPSKRDKT